MEEEEEEEEEEKGRVPGRSPLSPHWLQSLLSLLPIDFWRSLNWRFFLAAAAAGRGGGGGGGRRGRGGGGGGGRGCQ